MSGIHFEISDAQKFFRTPHFSLCAITDKAEYEQIFLGGARYEYYSLSIYVAHY